MLKPEQWKQCRVQAGLDHDHRVAKLDRLVQEYAIVKATAQGPSKPLRQHEKAREIVEVCKRYLEQARIRRSPAVAIVSVLEITAQDTVARLQFDVDASRRSGLFRRGPERKALEKSQRAEALDPRHRRWDASGHYGAYKHARQQWKQDILSCALSGNDLMRAFYGWLENDFNKPTVAVSSTRYLGGAEREQKRLLFVKPGNSWYPKRQGYKGTLILRKSKRRGGSFHPYTCSESQIFVMLPGGAFYVAKPRGKSGVIQHHSGLAGGEAIEGAGQLCVKDGRLVYVSQQSGHYRPSRRQMLQVLKVLEQRKIDLEQVTLGAYTYFHDPNTPDPNSNPRDPRPELSYVRADYYLKSGGKWASDPTVFAAAPELPRELPESVQRHRQAFQAMAAQRDPAQDSSPPQYFESGQPVRPRSSNGSQPPYANDPHYNTENPAPHYNTESPSPHYNTEPPVEGEHYNTEPPAPDLPPLRDAQWVEANYAKSPATPPHVYHKSPAHLRDPRLSRARLEVQRRTAPEAPYGQPVFVDSPRERRRSPARPPRPVSGPYGVAIPADGESDEWE